MKKNVQYYLSYLSFSVLFFIMQQHAVGQDFILGLKYGYGTSSFVRQSDDRKTPAYTTHKVALTTEFSPYYSKLFIASGLEYEMHELANGLTIPLSVRIVLGKTIRPFFEGGGYFTYSFTDPQDDYIVKNDLGAKVAAGIMLYLKQHWRLELGYYYRAGLTPALEEEIPLPLDQVTTEEYRRKAGTVEIAVKYRF